MTTREGYHRFQGDWQPSAAQRRVLDGIAAGRTNVELAAELGLSPETIKWHVSQLLAQTGCADRRALAAWWRRRLERRPLLLPLVSLVGRGAATLAALAFALLLLLAGLAAAPRVGPAFKPVRSLVTALLPAEPSPSPALAPGSAALATDSPTAVVRLAVTSLVIMYYQPLDAGQLFREAWTGAATALTQAGVSQLPPPPAYPSDLAAAQDLHTQHFPALEQLAAGRLAPETLTAAALVALTTNRHEMLTAYSSPALSLFGAGSSTQTGRPVGRGFTSSPRAPHVITSLVPGGPAEQAGVRRGEIVIAINGYPVGQLSATTVTQRLALAAALQPGSGYARNPLIFTVSDAAGRQRDVAIPSSPAQAPLDWHQVVGGDVGVIRLDALAIADPAQPGGFNATVVAERVAAVLGEFEQQGMQGWVLDLRGATSGGDPRALFDLLVSDGRLLGQLGRGRTTPIYIDATDQALPFQRPLVVLVSGSTLGGSEALAAALHAVGRATVVGEQTPGGFTLVRAERLPDGSVLYLPSHEVVVGPNDTRLNGIGLTPDLVVPGPTPLQDAAGQDPQLEAAVRLLHAQQSTP